MLDKNTKTEMSNLIRTLFKEQKQKLKEFGDNLSEETEDV